MKTKREIASAGTAPGLLFVLFFLLVARILPAQGQEAYQKELEKIRTEISRLESALQTQTRRESEALNVIEMLDKKVSLTKTLISKLSAGVSEQRKKVIKLQRELQSTSASIELRKKALARRVASLYKRGRFETLDILLGAQSLNRLKVWAIYQHKLAENDARQVRALQERQEVLGKLQQELQGVLSREKVLLDEKREEEQQLTRDRRKKSNALRSIRRDKALSRQQIADYQNAMKEIQQLIATSEAARKKSRGEKQNFSPLTGNFAEMKGHLPWPVLGKIIQPYGPYQHPILKTVTDNLGIDIEAAAGTPVHAVASGRVTAITWQRGRGNLVIINHGDGYYTVYTHLDEIFVQLQDDVVAGQVLGVVGEAGSFEISRLHFQVWSGFNHLNPEDWLE